MTHVAMFNLPDDIVKTVLSSWLNVLDFVALDKALLNHSLRSEYLRLLFDINGLVLSSLPTSATNHPPRWRKSNETSSMANWLRSRRLFLDSLLYKPSKASCIDRWALPLSVYNISLILKKPSDLQQFFEAFKSAKEYWEESKLSFQLPSSAELQKGYFLDDPYPLSNAASSTTKQPWQVLRLIHSFGSGYNLPSVPIPYNVWDSGVHHMGGLQTLIFDHMYPSSTACFQLLAQHCRNLRVLQFFRNEINVWFLTSCFLEATFSRLEVFITRECFYPQIEPEDDPIPFTKLLTAFRDAAKRPEKQLMHLKHIDTECLLAALIVQLAPAAEHVQIDYKVDWYFAHYQLNPLQAFTDHFLLAAPSLRLRHLSLDVFNKQRYLRDSQWEADPLSRWVSHDLFSPGLVAARTWTHLQELKVTISFPLQEDRFLRTLLPFIPSCMPQLQKLHLVCNAKTYATHCDSAVPFQSPSPPSSRESPVSAHDAEYLAARGLREWLAHWLVDLATQCPALHTLLCHDVFPLDVQLALDLFNQRRSASATQLIELFPRLQHLEIMVSNKPQLTFPAPPAAATFTHVSLQAPPLWLQFEHVSLSSLWFMPLARMHTLVFYGDFLTDLHVTPLLDALARADGASALRKLALHSTQFTSALFTSLLACHTTQPRGHLRRLSFVSCALWADFFVADEAVGARAPGSDDPEGPGGHETRGFGGVQLLLRLAFTLTGLRELRLFRPVGSLVDGRDGPAITAAGPTFPRIDTARIHFLATEVIAGWPQLCAAYRATHAVASEDPARPPLPAVRPALCSYAKDAIR